MVSKGTLYGVGVGPGDPDLLTIKAAATLGKVDRIFASSSSKNGFSLAESIARPHMRNDIHVERLGFPMTHDQGALQVAWEANAATVLQYLDLGEDVALITLGDPLLYSTFGYILQTIRRLRPEQPVEIIPGITSFQQAAAATGTILAESGEVLQIVPGIVSDEALRSHLECAENTVILKAYKNFSIIRQTLQQAGLDKGSLFVSRLGLEGERICTDLAQAPESPHYLSLVLVKREKNETRDS